MASLTASIDSPNNGKAIIGPTDPVRSNGGFLGGLANLAGDFIQGGVAKQERMKRDAQDLALDELAGGMREALGAANTELRAAKSAAEQGKLPQTGYELKLESKVDELFRMFPESRYEMSVALNQLGYDHYLLRDVKAAQADEDTQLQTQRNAESWEYNYAVQNGGFDPNASWAQNVQYGRNLIKADKEAEVLAARAAAVAKDRELTIEEKKLEQSKIANEAGFVVLNQLNAKHGPVLNRFAAVLAKAAEDPNMMKEFESLAPMVPGWIAAARQDAISQLSRYPGAGKDALEMVNTYFDQLTKDTTAFFTGDLSVNSTNARALQAFKTQTGIEIQNSMPLMTAFKDAFGSEAANELIGSAFAQLPEDTRNAMLAEVKGFNTASAREGKVIISNMINIAKGVKGLHDMSYEEAVKVIPGLKVGLEGAQNSIIQGNRDLGTLGTFANVYGNLTNAAIELQPVTTDLPNLEAATNLLSTRQARVSLDVMVKTAETKEQGMALVGASRASAAQMLETAKGLPQAKPDKFQSIKFDTKTGQYYIATDKTAYDKWAKGQKTPTYMSDIEQYPTGVPQFSEFTKGDPELVKVKNILNANLDHIVETDQYDSNIPKGATPLQRRLFWATGKVIPGTEATTGADGKPNANEAVYKSINDLRRDLQSYPAQVIQSGGGGKLNNPLNLRSAPTQTGQATQGNAGRFAVFGSLEDGISAAYSQLQRYNTKYGIKNLADAISRWAPPSENDTQSYINYVSKKAGVDPKAELNFGDKDVMARVMDAMADFEGNRSLTSEQIRDILG